MSPVMRSDRSIGRKSSDSPKVLTLGSVCSLCSPVSKSTTTRTTSRGDIGVTARVERKPARLVLDIEGPDDLEVAAAPFLHHTALGNRRDLACVFTRDQVDRLGAGLDPVEYHQPIVLDAETRQRSLTAQADLDSSPSGAIRSVSARSRAVHGSRAGVEQRDVVFQRAGRDHEALVGLTARSGCRLGALRCRACL